MKKERLTFGHGAHLPVPSRALAATAELAHEPRAFRFTHLETWDWGWGGLLIFSILLFFRPQDQIAALGRAHISDLSAVVGLIAMVFVNLGRRQSPIRVTAEVAAMGLLGIVLLVGVPFSIWPGGSFGVFTSLYIQVALIFLLMVNTVTSPRRVERICWVIVLAFGYISTRVIVDYFRGVNLVEGNRAAGPVGGFFENPNDLALNLAAFLPLAMMYVKRPGPAFKRLLCLLISVLMIVAMILTKSRSGMVGAVAMFAVFVLSARMIKPSFVLAAIVGAMLVLPNVPASFWERMASITDAQKDQTGSREERVLLMEQAWIVFLEHPLTGVGAGQFKNFGPPGQGKRWRETHNVLLQVAAELGFVGLVTFIFLIVRAFAAAWWTRRALNWIYFTRPKRRGATTVDPEDGLDEHDRMFLQTHGAAMLACLAGWMVAATFASVAFNWTFYYLLGLAVTARDVVRARRVAYAKAKALAEEEMVAA
jgi:O-antigen ligase